MSIALTSGGGRPPRRPRSPLFYLFSIAATFAVGHVIGYLAFPL